MRTACLAIITLLAACSGDMAPTTSQVRDSAGIRIVEVLGPIGRPASIRIGREPLYQVGWNDTGEVFEDVVAGALWDDGRAVVADGKRLVLLSPEGVVEAVLGGPGQGPGEFQSLSSLALFGEDTILVQDPRAGRLSLFSQSGFARSLSPGPLGNLQLLEADASRGEAMLGLPLYRVLGRTYEAAFLAVPLVRVDLRTGDADTVGLADWDQSITVGGGNNPFMSGGFASAAAGEFVVGHGLRPEIRWVDAEGRPRQIVRWASRPVQVPDTMVARWEATTRAVMKGLRLEASDIEERIATMKEAIREPLPHFGIAGPMPPAGGLMADPAGDVWIAAYRAPREGPPRTYYVVTREGEWAGAVSIPEGLSILAVGRDRLLGMQRSELDVESVALFELER